MRMQILLPHDGSRASMNALRHVARNLEGVDAEVLVLNVQQVIVDAEMLHAAHSIAQLHRSEGEAILRPALDYLASNGVRCSGEVAFGPSAAVIARVAEDRGFDFIVMGTRARHPLLEFITRAVPRRVLRRSRVPVVLIPDERASPPLPAALNPA